MLLVLGGMKSPNGNTPTFPIMYPAMISGIFPPQQNQEQTNRGPGLYAVPVHPHTQTLTGFPIPPNTLIPFTYNLPSARSSSENRDISGGQGHEGEQPQQQQQGGPQRPVRRFIAIQLDLLLILKLAAVIFLFNQDGSRQRLTLLVFFASLVYLYQTGALAPVIRWLSQGMQRPAVRADNQPAAAAAGPQGNENVAGAEGQAMGENENQQVNDGNRAIENEAAEVPEQGDAVNRFWVIVKEIQLIVFGFITSLLPGFHNID